MFDNTFVNRVIYKVLVALLVPVCLGWWGALRFNPTLRELRDLDPLRRVGSERSVPHHATELPRHWNGAPLRPLALSEVEQRFARRFPGTLARLTDGEQVLVLRAVHRPTRMLHPAMDCYRALGYRIALQRLQLDAQERMWRCFEAERDGRRLLVCERIVDAAGAGFTDTSSWYWSALLGQSPGPWQALTVARPL